MTSRAGIALAVVAIAAVSGCKKPPEQKPPPPAPVVPAQRPVKRPVTENLEYTGSTEALAKVDLRARVQGYLEKILFTEGKPVKKGDLLFVIEKAQFKAAVDHATSELASRKAILAGSEADAQLAAELADQRAGPEIDRVLKAARRDSSKAGVDEAKAALERAELELSYCEIRAPIDGTITKTEVDVGNLVGHGDPTLLATIVSDRPIYVNINASEADLLRAKRAERVRREQTSGDRGMDEIAQRSPHAPATPAAAPPAAPAPGATPAPPKGPVGHPVFLALGDERDFKIGGEIDYLDPAVNKTTGTILIRMVFENADGFLVPGMFVRIRIPLDTRECIVVPQTALSQDQAGFYALGVDDGGTVVRKRVKVGAVDGADRVILEGLTEEDRIIVEGLQRARVGGKVEVKAAPSESGAAPKAPAPKPSLQRNHKE